MHCAVAARMRRHIDCTSATLLQDWGFVNDPNYLAYQKFQEQFLLSPVRTEDPSEANLFWIPLNLYSYSGGAPYCNQQEGAQHCVPLPAPCAHLRYANACTADDARIWQRCFLSALGRRCCLGLQATCSRGRTMPRCCWTMSNTAGPTGTAPAGATTFTCVHPPRPQRLTCLPCLPRRTRARCAPRACMGHATMLSCPRSGAFHGAAPILCSGCPPTAGRATCPASRWSRSR